MTAGAWEHRAVIVMAKRPAAGSTKTRMTPALSPQQAADLYEQLLLDTLDFLQVRTDCTTVIAVDKPTSAAYFTSISPGTTQVQQVGDALGDRLDTVLTSCLDQGFGSVFAIGSDSPDLPASHLDDAFAALDRDDVDVVLGPTEDGGYYLIGWKRRWSRLVVDVEMSTPRVLDDTLAIARELGAAVHLAPTWYDIDTTDDLARLHSSETATPTPRTTKFVATLNPTAQ